MSNGNGEVILSRGTEHPAASLLSYLQNASTSGLDRFQDVQQWEAANARDRFLEMLKAWIHAEALKLHTTWLRRQPQRIEPEARRRAAAVERPIEDLDSAFDPFIRPARESRRIRAGQEPSERGRWGKVYEEHGCFRCATKDRAYHSSGLCLRCWARGQRWLSLAEARLRMERVMAGDRGDTPAIRRAESALAGRRKQ